MLVLDRDPVITIIMADHDPILITTADHDPPPGMGRNGNSGSRSIADRNLRYGSQSQTADHDPGHGS